MGLFRKFGSTKASGIAAPAALQSQVPTVDEEQKRRIREQMERELEAQRALREEA
jgi:hypothetical protein